MIGHTTSGAVPRSDAVDKVTGAARYTGDLRLPGMLHAALVRSSRPHARRSFVESSAARQAPGVVAVITAEDLEALDPWFGNIVLDRPVLAQDVVRFVGEPVAIVVADTPARARAAAAVVHVGYEDLPVVDSVESALEAALPIHQGPYRPGGISAIQVDPDLGRNIAHRHRRSRGDVDDLPDGALVLDDTFRFPAVYQYAMEPHTALARWDGEQLEVWSTAQHPFAVRRELARILGLDLAGVRVSAPYIGGGFGSKSWTKIEPLAAVASWVLQAPVRLALTMQEAMVTSRRHNAEVEVRSVFTPEGRLHARRVHARFDTGAYTDNGPQVIAVALDAAIAPYDVAAYDLDAVAVFTNTPPAGSMRAIGTPQVHWGCERHVDLAADRLGIDPLELRRRNLAPRGRHLFPRMTPVDADLASSLDLLEAALDDDQEPPLPGRVRGRGVALAMTGAGGSPISTAWIRMHADGSVTVHAASTELGQGSRTALRQLVVRRLGLPVTRVGLVAGDTRSAPYDQSTGASRTTTVTGRALMMAVDDLLTQLRAIAADLGGVHEASVEVADGKATWPGGEADYADLVAHEFGSAGGELLGHGATGGGRLATFEPGGPLFWEVAMSAADVEVDLETGQARVTRYVAVSDVGAVVHGPSIRGQETGAVVMGIGHTLSETLRFSEGQLITPDLASYHVPIATDAPFEIVTDHVANGDGPGPFGSRGIGEGAVVPVAASITNALRRALGVEVTRLPVTTEDLWRAIEDLPTPPQR